MTSWDVYWVLMLDSIKNASGFCAFLFGMFGVIAVFAAIMTTACEGDGVGDCEPRIARIVRRTAYCLVPVWIVSGLLYVFVPTTKQAAVIYVLPRIATTENIEAVQSEAGEMYSLAKRWLEEQVGEAKDSGGEG